MKWKWSKYNFLFESEKFNCFFLFNTLSSGLYKLDKNDYKKFIQIKQNPNNNDIDEELKIQLIQNKILTENDKVEFLKLKLIKQIHRFDRTKLVITIAPTLHCNFNCSYCFEQSRPNIYMSDKTENDLIAFIKKHDFAKSIFITWFGGEPLLAFDRIRSLTTKIKDMNISFNADIVTNGFEFDQAKIYELKELNINKVHITIDGLEEMHNRRRPHIDNINCFAKIINNLDILFNYKREHHSNLHIAIRVNIDKENGDEYQKIYKFLNDRYKNEEFIIYVGFVKLSYGSCKSTEDILFNNAEQADFVMEGYKTHNIPNFYLLPEISMSECIARNINGYLIDPEGYIYKCWTDIGNKEEYTGHIADESLTKIDRLAKYLVGSDVFTDAKCQNCKYMPICGGGCPHHRIKNEFTDIKTDVCHIAKSNIEKYIELYYEGEFLNK